MSVRVVGLLLAAGRGRRFAAAHAADGAPGSDGPARGGSSGSSGSSGDGASSGAPARPDKLLASIDGTPVARRALEALAAGCDAVIAVVRPDAPAALRDALRDATLVDCVDADLGMGHSLAAAARAALHARADAVLVLPADMPWLDATTVVAIATAAREGDGDARASRIVVPTLPDGRRGHPIAFGAAHLDALSRLSGDRGARGLVAASVIHAVVVDDAGILRDVDTPSDLTSS